MTNAKKMLDRVHRVPLPTLYIGGMGAKGKNFYNALVSRYGYEAEAAEIQELYLAGRKGEAAAKIPDGASSASSRTCAGRPVSSGFPRRRLLGRA